MSINYFQFALKSDAWTMVYRIVKASGDDPYDIWMSNSALNEGETNMRTTDETVPGTFKSPIVDSLQWHRVKKVSCLSICYLWSCNNAVTIFCGSR